MKAENKSQIFTFNTLGTVLTEMSGYEFTLPLPKSDSLKIAKALDLCNRYIIQF